MGSSAALNSEFFARGRNSGCGIDRAGSRAENLLLREASFEQRAPVRGRGDLVTGNAGVIMGAPLEA